MLTLHNLAYYLRLMGEVRTAICEGRFEDYRSAATRRLSGQPFIARVSNEE